MTSENLINKEEVTQTGFSLRNFITIIIAVISLLSIIALASVGYWFWQRTTQQLNQQNQQLLSLKSQLTEQQTNLQTLNQHWQQLSQWQIQINRWQLAQAEYYVQLANFHLQTEINVNSAIQLLKMAQSGLTDNDPALANIQQLLSQNINTLQALALPDPAQLIANLDKVNQQIAQLPLYEQKPATTEQNHSPTHNNTASTNKFSAFWQQHFANFLDHLRHLVTIRYTPAQVYTPTQRIAIQQAIQLKLLQAEWAVLQHQNDLYQQSLQQVSRMLQQTYPVNIKPTQQVLEALNQLQQTVIAPKLPDINSTITAIRNLRQQLNAAAATARPPALSPPVNNAPKANEQPAQSPVLIPHPPAAESITS